MVKTHFKKKKPLQEQKTAFIPCWILKTNKLNSYYIAHIKKLILKMVYFQCTAFAFRKRKVHKASEFLAWDVNAIIHWLKGSKIEAEGCIRITSDYVLPRL